MAAAQTAGHEDDAVSTSVSLLVLRWQASGVEAAFEAIVEQVRPQVERVVERVLRRQGLRDPAAVDDAVSLVFDHLRRLSGGAAQERSVAKFAPVASGENGRAATDPGRSFIACLAADRARDVARARRRQRSVPFSQLGAESARAFEQRLTTADPAAVGPPPIDRVRAAAERLEPRQRLLVELLLEGKSQAVIAHVLGVCEGTVSRLRAQAITTLRSLVAE
jgi:DNA-directed RNA polymerase specialized sigma24 family protein